jgi:hypothetical protein
MPVTRSAGSNYGASCGCGDFDADAARDADYREALDAARGPVSGGMPLEDAVRIYRPAS